MNPSSEGETNSTLRARRLLLLAIAIAVAIFATLPRLAYRVNLTTRPDGGSWISLDPDGYYHMRRLERLFEEGLPVAASDSLLNHPDGANIPWPPYYTLGLGAVLAPFLPDEPAAARVRIEHFTSSISVLFGVLTALLAALVGGRLAGPAGALGAGGYYSFLLASINYSSIGNGDHHAFVSFLHAAVLVLFTVGLARGMLEGKRRAALFGLALGALAGIGLGSWVAFLTYVLEVELMLAVLLFVNARRSLVGLASLGLGFHLGALLLLLPAVLQSPWQSAEPWSVVNLSWFHPLFLVLGVLVFVPIALGELGPAWRRRYPWMVGLGLVAVAGVCALFESGPAQGVRQAFAWASGEDSFMATIDESRSIFAARGEAMLALGYGLLLLPIAWIAMGVAWFRGRMELLPWVVSAPILAIQALVQLRFADALAMPLALLVGWGLALGLARLSRRLAPNTWLAAGAVLALALLGQQPSLAEQLEYRRSTNGGELANQRQVHLAATRRMAEWLRGAELREARKGVLGSWGFGHLIEWVAARPSVATNFGHFVGADGYATPARFLMSEDPAAARRILEQREVGYVLLTSRLTEQLPDLIGTVDPELLTSYLAGVKKGWKGGLRPRWFRTIGARLLLAGSGGVTNVPGGASPPLNFLRLVHASPEFDPSPPLAGLVARSPRGWIWEHVAGAELVAHGAPGTELRIQFELTYPGTSFRLQYTDRAVAGEDGVARLRLPYAVPGRNGDGVASSGPIFEFGGRRGLLNVSEEEVRTGSEVRL